MVSFTILVSVCTERKQEEMIEMTKEEAVTVLQMLTMSVSTCRTERQALELAIELMKGEEEDDTDRENV